jgi:hypothetical protein
MNPLCVCVCVCVWWPHFILLRCMSFLYTEMIK